jgi:hypothetical protein
MFKGKYEPLLLPSSHSHNVPKPYEQRYKDNDKAKQAKNEEGDQSTI